MYTVRKKDGTIRAINSDNDFTDKILGKFRVFHTFTSRGFGRKNPWFRKVAVDARADAN
jgi:hypothetical protein